MTSSSPSWLGLAVLGLMLFAWLAAGVATALLLAVLIAPDHFGFGESLRGWEGQLPDPATFPQSAARFGEVVARLR
jgi:hypothetical protein